MLVGVKIAPRIVLLFLPILIVPLALQTWLATGSARRGIAAVAADHLRFKTEELLRFADSQLALLEANKLAASPSFRSAAMATVASYAKGLVRSPGERIAAIDGDGRLAFEAGEGNWSPGDLAALARILHGATSGPAATAEGWRELALPDGPRVSFVAAYPPFGWTIAVTVLSERFFGPVTAMAYQGLMVALVAAAVATALLAASAGLITRPIRKVARGMRAVVETGDLSQRVSLPYDDEIGDLGDSFDQMASSLEAAYTELKHYALETAVAHKREARIRNIFQKYVPAPVIERFFASPESMLVGEDRRLAVLFSDIRDFTAYSETLSSHEVVASLNRYFGRMAEAVFRHDGIVDKYIGDALMAFFGAPAPDERSAYHAVTTAFDMLKELGEFNAFETAQGRAPIAIGIGLNYGSMTIGNIGSEKKMDYTVIGDMVNLASRLEGLTKYYREPLILSDTVRDLVAVDFPTRAVDRVRVKGREGDLVIYTARLSLGAAEEEAWELHAQALSLYYERRFAEAAAIFGKVLRLLPDDPVTLIFLERCTVFATMPPPPEWNGVVAHSTK
jgi:class 3 adenylate cyclase/HAMP domain-containing protein